MKLETEISSFLDWCVDGTVRKDYEVRLTEGKLTRDESLHSHFCAYFVPVNVETKQVLIGDHKKSGLWLMPGGHIDAGEGILTTLNREIEEELGVSDFFTDRPDPFLLTTTTIVSDVRPCQKHYDSWFAVETDGADFAVDYTEYHEVRWVSFATARELITDPANLQAIDALEKLYRN